MENFLDHWGLALAVFIPLVGAALMMFIPRAQEELHKWIALLTSAVVLGVTILVAVYFDAFRGRRPLLAGFLRGYGWDRGGDFGRRALQGVLEFQFDAISRISEMVDLTGVTDLDQLAERLFG